jgi:methionine synthase II (cobalamin-independent)
MKNVKMYKTKHCKVNYLEKQNAVFCQWKQFCKGDDYREPLEFGLNLLLKTGATTWITDTTNGFENAEEDTQWLLEEFLPKVLQTNYKKIVFIMEQDSPLKEEIDAQAVTLGEYFEVLQVESLEELEKVQDE